MAKDAFEMHGFKELSNELKSLKKGMRTKIVKPGVRKGGAEVRKAAKRIAPKDTGLLRKSIKSKVTARKGVVARIGVLDTSITDAKGNAVAKYAAAVNEKDNFLEEALQQAEQEAFNELLSSTQQRIDAFHNSQPTGKK